ncbi:hypothetical protein BOSEA31B_14121 [Hyphomicrobiales bacterium]|nr:hypothetical protein BOSEA31B_14121 [Hyphomicrobiales bacterium]CAH1699898.1 hypothetical protein BOSEA1005_12951 [Hyphomicrobiales bacterium]CAI0343628.1 hypothetical protein BO1005MUT1_280130 [Hyphomicrobiales bacterium]
MRHRTDMDSPGRAKPGLSERSIVRARLKNGLKWILLNHIARRQLYAALGIRDALNPPPASAPGAGAPPRRSPRR